MKPKRTQLLVWLLSAVVLVLAMVPGWVAASDKATIEEQFRQAVRNGQLDEIKALVDKGGYVNAKINSSYTVLMYATWRRHLDVVKFLIDKGVDVNAKDRDGRTAISIASNKKESTIVEYLKAHGAK